MQVCCLYQVTGNILVVISDVGGIDIYILGDIKTHIYQYHYNLDQNMVDDPMLMALITI